MKALYDELLYKIRLNNIDKFETIFFGGGTPSSLKISLYKDIFLLLQNHIDKNTEITFEANPNSATKEWLEAIKEFGATRVSFGVQSFDDEKLKYLGRAHDNKKAIQAIELAQQIGFDSINCDILYNTICDSKQLIQKDLEIVSSLQIPHISAYSLTIEEETKFHTNQTQEIFDEDFSIFVIDSILKADYLQYEISNFAKTKHHFSSHNLGYWKKKDYMGVGAGAVECIGCVRSTNQKNLSQYIQKSLPILEHLTPKDQFLEEVFLGLRSIVGIDEKILNDRQKNNADTLVKNGNLLYTNQRYYNTNFLVCDEIALYLTR